MKIQDQPGHVVFCKHIGLIKLALTVFTVGHQVSSIVVAIVLEKAQVIKSLCKKTFELP